MSYTIKEVLPMKDMILKIVFTNGKKKLYDVKPLISKWKVFEQLKDEKLFNQVKVDRGGYGISWNEDIDLECNELWYNGTLIK